MKVASCLFAVVSLIAVYVWATEPGNLRFLPHLTAIAAVTMLLIGAGASYRRQNLRPLLSLEAIGFGMLFLPSVTAIATAPRSLPAPLKLWTTTLQKGTWDGMNTGSEFEATRRLVFAGDRLLAVYESAMAPYRDKQPMAEQTLVSLDVRTAAERNEKRFARRWGSTPHLFGTQSGNALISDGDLMILHPDLTDTGVNFEIHRGRVEAVSPDGYTLAWETNPGITFLNANTLSPSGTKLDASIASSISQDAALTTIMSWPVKFPSDHFFLTLIDTHGSHLIFHDECSGQPAFLTNDLIFVAGCGGITLLDREGHIVKRLSLHGEVRFAGVSQNGKSFAVEISESRGDPSVVIFEHFILFNTQTAQPLAMVRSEHMPARQLWSAFSADGRLFASGDPDALSLYEVPER